MYSYYQTPFKKYVLKTHKYVCNKFGLAEFFAKNFDYFCDITEAKVLDVGCGVLPLGIFLADQKKYKITGIEINPIAYVCAKENINKLNLNKYIELINCNFANFIDKKDENDFDLIISNPPINDRISTDEILKFSNVSLNNLDSKSFSYITNSWHSDDSKDLTDYIFEFGEKSLNNKCRIIIVFCDIDCSSPDYVFNKAKKYGYKLNKVISDYIFGKNVGAEFMRNKKIRVFMTEFRR